MRRYQTIVKIEKIRALLEEGEYVQAQQLADQIDPQKLKKRGDVHVLAEAYKMGEQYEMAQLLLMRLYEERESRRLLEELLELSLLQKNIEEAEKYFEKYKRVSGGDPENYIYEYRLGRLKGKAYEELLPLLQTLKEEQYMEKYAYELAKVYHKLGRSEECLAECSDLILWFGEGRYVEKAKTLQAYYTGEIQLDEIQHSSSGQESVTEYSMFGMYTRIAEETQIPSFGVYTEPEEESFVSVEEPIDEPEEEIFVPVEEPINEPEEEPFIPVDEPANEPEEESEAFVPEEPMSAYERLMREAAAMEDEPEEEAFVPAEEMNNEQEESLYVPVNEADTEPFGDALPSEAEQGMLLYLQECGISLEDTLHTFSYISTVRSQLLQGLDFLASVNPECYCMVVTGERKGGKTTFGKNIVKLLYQMSWLKKPKVAVITGTKMNEISLEEKKVQLQGCCLIIEKAGRMSEETAERLISFIQNEQILGMVILEDRDKRINYLMRNHPEWNALFSVRIQLPKYTAEHLFGFAVDYVKEQDYNLEEEAEAVLYEKIADLVRTEAGEGRLMKTLQLVKDALEKAEERNQKAILNMMEHGSFSANDVLILKHTDLL